MIQFCGNNLKVRTDKCWSSALLVVRTLPHPLFFLFSVCLSDRQPPPIHRCRKIGQLCRLCRLFWAISPIFDAGHCTGSSGFPRLGGDLAAGVAVYCDRGLWSWSSGCQCVLHDFITLHVHILCVNVFCTISHFTILHSVNLGLSCPGTFYASTLLNKDWKEWDKWCQSNEQVSSGIALCANSHNLENLPFPRKSLEKDRPVALQAGAVREIVEKTSLALAPKFCQTINAM